MLRQGLSSREKHFLCLNKDYRFRMQEGHNWRESKEEALTSASALDIVSFIQR